MRKAVVWLLTVVAVFVVMGVLVAQPAFAQSITLPTSLYRKQPVRPVGQLPSWVNRADCLAGDVLTFYPVSLSGYSGDTLQVWAGARGIDCSTATNRTVDGTQCFLLYDRSATAAATRVDVPAVDLVTRSMAAAAEDSHGHPAACSSTGSNAYATLALYFVLVDPTSNVVATASWNDTGVDVVAPPPPTDVTGGRGDTRIVLDFTPSSANDVRSYQFYCDPAPGTVYPDGGLIPGSATLAADALAADAETTRATSNSAATTSDAGTPDDAETPSATSNSAATTSDAGTPDGGASTTLDGGASTTASAGTGGAGTGGAGTSTVAECATSSVLVPNTDPVYPGSLSRYACGKGASGQTSPTVTNLVDYVDYVVAVAAVDQAGNVGPLSNQVCEVPAQVSDFYDLYRQAGGKAGGGICSVSRLPSDSPPGAAYVLVMGVLGVAVRRARKRGAADRPRRR